MANWLQINPKRAYRLMKLMGLQAIYPKKRTSTPGKPSKKFPYLLKGLSIVRPNQVWSTDITYIPLKNGFLYLVAIMDWYSRYILSWDLSNTMDVSFCLRALETAFKKDKCEIFNNDQGSQFTADEFWQKIISYGANVSWDGKGRALDNVFIERFWWSLKHEEVYFKSYETGEDAYNGIKKYIHFFCNERQHQSLGYKTPYNVYKGK